LREFVIELNDKYKHINPIDIPLILADLLHYEIGSINKFYIIEPKDEKE
jgi:hypothetical protein